MAYRFLIIKNRFYGAKTSGAFFDLKSGGGKNSKIDDFVGGGPQNPS